MTIVSHRYFAAAAMATMTVMAQSQDNVTVASDTGARAAATKAAQHVVAEAKGSLPSQVLLIVEAGVQQRAVEAGFLEVLVRSGVTPHLERGAGEELGTLLVRFSEDPDGTCSFDVRIEQGIEKRVSYAELIHVSPDDPSGWERLLIPVVLVASTVMVVYLLFTVRS